MHRLTLIAAAVLLLLAGCSSAEQAPDPVPPVVRTAGATPEETIQKYIQAQRDGDPEAMRPLLWPDDAKFTLRGPAAIEEFQIRQKRVLSADDAAQFTSGPVREAGDVEVMVWEVYGGGRTQEITYFLREVDGVWRIYSLTFPL